MLDIQKSPKEFKFYSKLWLLQYIFKQVYYNEMWNGKSYILKIYCGYPRDFG